MSRDSSTSDAAAARPWLGVLAGLSAMLVGIGLGRFAYTPILPALIDAGWFKASAAAYLGAANLAGYLAGALLAQPLAQRLSVRAVLRGAMVVGALAFFACANPVSFAWYFVWRFAAGVVGGVLMVLAAAAVLPHVPEGRRGLAGGVIFTGVGLGIAASGTIVPLMMRLGLVETWLCLGVIAAVLTALAWGGWPRDAARPTLRVAASTAPTPPLLNRALIGLYALYALTAVGLVPHMVFLVDFVARGLDKGLAVGSAYWVLLGLGAMVGPTLAGHIGDRLGFALALRLALVVQSLCAGWLVVSGDTLGLVVSSFVTGAIVPGVVPLVLGRVHDLIPTDTARRTIAWSRVTASFAIGQAAAAYGLSFVYAQSESYALLFAIAAGALGLALAIDLGLLHLAKHARAAGTEAA